MLCGKCGKNNKGDSKFCLACGSELIDNQPVANAAPMQETKAEQFVFCGECGTRNDGGLAICTSCRSKLTDNRPPPSVSLPTTSIPTTPIASVNVKAKIPDITVTVIKIVALVLCIAFFFPLFTVSCQGREVASFSGWSSTFGKTIDMGMAGVNKIDGNFLVVLLFLIPAALFILFLIKKNAAFCTSKTFYISTGLSIIGVIGYIVFNSGVKKAVMEYTGMSFTLDFTFWYYLAIILYVSIATLSGASAYIMLSQEKSAMQISSSNPGAS